MRETALFVFTPSCRMPPSSQNPLVIVAWILAVFVGLPGLVAGVKVIFFVARATGKLDDVIAGQAALSEEFRDYRHDKRNESTGVDLSLTLIESDINTLQEKAGVPVRRFPDRRTGPSDRRAS